MKVTLTLFLVLLGLMSVKAEIVPRFPGVQPLTLGGSTQNNNDTEFSISRILDPFDVDTSPPVIVIIPSPGAPPSVTETGFDQASSIVGGERDIILTVNTGTTSKVFTAGASGGAFTISSPGGASGVVELQYDGTDGSSQLDLNPGLGGLSLTEDGSEGFILVALTDIDTEFTIEIYDGTGSSVSASSEVTGGVTLQSFFLPFADFDGLIDIDNIVAIRFIIQAFSDVDFLLETFGLYGPTFSPADDCLTFEVLPCDTDYYRLAKFTDIQPGDYLVVEFAERGPPSNPDSGANFYVVTSNFEDLQSELASNEHIVDTLGGLPGPRNYRYKCNQDCVIEIVYSELENTTYYFGVEGTGNGITEYELCIYRRSVPLVQLFDGVSKPVFRAQRPTVPPDDRVLYYDYYYIDIPITSFADGTYLVVNMSRAEPFPGLEMRLMYNSLPERAFDTGVIGDIDVDSTGSRADAETYQFCVNTSQVVPGKPYTENPAYWQDRIPCSCFTAIQVFGAGPAFQLTCNLTVDPCHFIYGRWYVSVLLPERRQPTLPTDTSGFANYTLTAYVISPGITELFFRNVTYKGFVEPEYMTHYKINVPASETSPTDHFHVHVSNINNAFLDIWVHKGLGGNKNLAGGWEACVPANATCRTCDACNVIIEKCHFGPGTWYISVSIAYDDDGKLLIFDPDHFPITYTIRANWAADATPTKLLAGVPVSKYLGEALYDFYSITVPKTIDTVLIAELYARANDTEVILAALTGSLPGGECYSRPDFYCMTGDPYGKRWTTGPPTFYDEEPVVRESCSIMIQSCQLAAGTLYFSVYGHHYGYVPYGDHTYYQVPVYYTLWVDFDSPLPIKSSVSYTETVFTGQYQHYYVRADPVPEGSWLSVEVTNIQHLVPQAVEVFVNYHFLAGTCPCYENLFNCTSDATACDVSSGLTYLNDQGFGTALTNHDTKFIRCCTIIVPASDFRPGVWYISVLGINEDYLQYTTPIGYTLTATVHKPQVFHPLLLGQPAVEVVPQWNKTLIYSQFKLAADAVPLNDLIIKVTWVQNCEFMGKHDDKNDVLYMYINKGSPAGESLSGHQWWCKADIYSDSYCTVVIPHCVWTGDDYYVSIRGDFRAVFDGRFTLSAHTDEVRSVALTDGVPQYGRVFENQYDHYFIHTDARPDQYLFINIYTNQDQDLITAYLNKDEHAGDEPCFRNTASCTTQTCCTWQLLACELEAGRYYISIRGATKQFYYVSTEYTLLAQHLPVVTHLTSLDPVTGHLYNVGDVQHYSISIEDIAFNEGLWLRFTVDNVKHGAVTVYSQYEYLAGVCPCFINEKSCSTSGDNDYCSIRYAPCELQRGTYYFGVYASEITAPNPLVFGTPVGFTVLVEAVQPRVQIPDFEVGRFDDLTQSAVVFDEKYIHFALEYTLEDFNAGYHIIVEITSVQDGSLSVYYQQIHAADAYEPCHTAQICTSGLAYTQDCYWQLPYCLTKPWADNTEYLHYISVKGTAPSATSFVFFNFLAWKQPVQSVIANPDFTLDNALPIDFTPDVELNITHSELFEPYGWNQFIRLPDVSHPDTLRGELLELFFYRITNNPGEDMSFNVYVIPNRPAGAHGCCDKNNRQEMGSCQEAPCSETADTTTLVGGLEQFSHTCEMGVGIGDDDEADIFFGGRCTVRVWPCEFNKYCNDTTDWYVSVVPVSPQGVTGKRNGPGLQYSFQWRVRDIRLLDETLVVGTTELSSAVNTFEWTEKYDIPWTTTESEGWRSFVVTYPVKNTRFSIQTQLSGPNGIVYINGNEFASETSTCNDYVCSTSSPFDCASDGRYLVTERCTEEYDSFYITVRNTADEDLDVSFRITDLPFNTPIAIPLHPSEAVPYVATGSATLFTTDAGVFGESYDWYYLAIDDNDLDLYQSWVVDVEYSDTSDSADTLVVYIRYGTSPGNFDVIDLQSYYGTVEEASYAWQYSCNLSPASRCTWQIPHCSLIKGYYYIGIWNPTFVTEGTTANVPNYVLTTYISDVPASFNLDGSLDDISDSVPLGLLKHYTFTVGEDDLQFDNPDFDDTYWVRWLRVGVTNITDVTNINNVITLSAWINYEDLAGDPSFDPCLNFLVALECTTGDGCFYDFTPCESDGSVWRLKTGTYFLSILDDNSDASWTVYASILSEIYSPIPLTGTFQGDSHRLGSTDNVWIYNVTDAELASDGIGNGYYNYVIDLTGETDDLDDNVYLIINITTPATTEATDAIHLEVWRDDCSRFHCDLLGPRSWCTIDALTLAPCSAKGGRYYFRVFNPDAAAFTLYFYENQTNVQTLQDGQLITEIIYPYEYQEYYWEAVEVGLGAVLQVKICSICGDVQAFLRPDLPAGPYPDISGAPESCAIDSCRATGPKRTSFDEVPDNCCQLVLDTCNYEQRGYYIGIRGRNTVYPSNNEHIYLPAKYEIEATQTIVNFTAANVGCPFVVNYLVDPQDVPRQWYVDIQSVNIGSSIRVSVRLDARFASVPNAATVWVGQNYSLGYTDSCPGDAQLSCTTSTSCSFIIPYCKFLPYHGSRWFIYADAPRGTEILVEQWDPVVPIIYSNLRYHGTINQPNNGIYDLPYTPALQIYKIYFDPHQDENYYERFFVRIYLSTDEGNAQVLINSGQYPYRSNTGCPEPILKKSCSTTGNQGECFVDVEYSEIRDIPQHYYWVTVLGGTQQCQLHSIKYSFIVQSNWVIRYFPVNDEICDTVGYDEYNFHRLRPREVEFHQHTVLSFNIDTENPENDVALLLYDGYLATQSESFRFDTEEGVLSETWYCGYNDLYFSVLGTTEQDDDASISYRIGVEKITVPVKLVENDSIYYADDDDDDACPHEHDFYLFKTAQPLGHHHGSFLRVLVDSLFPTTVYVNKNTFAWTECADSGVGSNDPAVTGTTSVNVYDFCDFADGLYYITVVSEGPYYLYTHIRDDAIPLTLGSVYRHTLEQGQFQVFTLEICRDWYRADDRLVVEISDVQNGNVYGWINYNSPAGYFETSEGEGSCALDTAYAAYGPGESGYDFFLVNSFHLLPGTYYILIRAAPYPTSPERNCQDVTFRLFPYLIDYEIDPVEISPNVVVPDAVDYYTINRINPASVQYINYYKVMPLMENQGFVEQVSHAVLRVFDITGGLVRVRVACDRLALPENAYIDGSIKALTKGGLINGQWKLQSGFREHTYLQVIDSEPSKYQPESTCDGVYDFCEETSYDYPEVYEQDKSLAIWLPSCYLIWADFYIAVEAVEQFSLDKSIEYSIKLEQTRDYILLQTDQAIFGEFTNDNWDYDFYYSISAGPESMRWRVVVIEGEGVLVTVRNHRCPRQATWSTEVWCDVDSYEARWNCDIEIPTRASHPGDSAFFVAVYGKNATYSIGFWRGRENCHQFRAKGFSEGLNFCAGIVDYPVWRWDEYVRLDNEANCLFRSLYDHFRVQPCWSGVSIACNNTLKEFACYESFHGCDAEGFSVGTCRSACDDVVYECYNWFESVNLEHFNCSSSRYLDSNVQPCTGTPEFSEAKLEAIFTGDPKVILYDTKSSATHLRAGSLLLVLVAIILAIL